MGQTIPRNGKLRIYRGKLQLQVLTPIPYKLKAITLVTSYTHGSWHSSDIYKARRIYGAIMPIIVCGTSIEYALTE